MYNLLRNMGGAVGIAFVTTLLARRSQFHQARLVDHLTVFDPALFMSKSKFAAALAARGGLGCGRGGDDLRAVAAPGADARFQRCLLRDVDPDAVGAAAGVLHAARAGGGRPLKRATLLRSPSGLRGPDAADLHRAPCGPPMETSPSRHPSTQYVLHSNESRRRGLPRRR